MSRRIIDLGYPRRTAKQQLGDLADALYSAIYNMTPRQRSAALRALDGLTTTNCGWILYGLRQVLRGLINDASSSRERNARARARKGAA
jgi:hypothetical protein